MITRADDVAEAEFLVDTMLEKSNLGTVGVTLDGHIDGILLGEETVTQNVPPVPGESKAATATVPE
jgi:hypothetical protein